MAMLKSKGLLFDDEQAAVECLKIISYFRLANYWKPMESDKVNHVFKPKSKFENVVVLYNFDKELRTIIFQPYKASRLHCVLKLFRLYHLTMVHFGLLMNHYSPTQQSSLNASPI